MTVIDHDPAALDAAPRLVVAETPATILGGEDGEGPSLFEVHDVALLADGSVAVANRGSQEVLVFRSDGSLSRRMGRPGDGPGEFRNLLQVLPRGPDTLLVWDSWNRRATWFGPDGAVLGVRSMEATLAPSSFARLRPLQTGFGLFVSLGPFPQEVGRARTPLESLRLDDTLAVAGSFGVFPTGEVARGSSGVFGLARFAAMPHAVSRGDSLVVGTAEGTWIDVVAPGGRVVRRIRWPDADRTVTESMRQALIERDAADVPDEMRADFRSRFGEPVLFADQYPPYEYMVGDHAGRVWVGRSTDPSDWNLGGPRSTAEWLVFGVDGRLDAVATTPEGFRPVVIRGDVLWGVHEDALGVETVRAYRYGPG